LQYITMLLCGAHWLFMILEARTSFWCRHRTVIAKLPGLDPLETPLGELTVFPRYPSRINGGSL